MRGRVREGESGDRDEKYDEALYGSSRIDVREALDNRT
jgi:hypothetical protein